MKQLLIRPRCSAPLPFFCLSPLCHRQPFRQEIGTLRGRLWTFLLQTSYAARHTPGWEALSPKHKERILAGKGWNSVLNPGSEYGSNVNAFHLLSSTKAGGSPYIKILQSPLCSSFLYYSSALAANPFNIQPELL